LIVNYSIVREQDYLNLELTHGVADEADDDVFVNMGPPGGLGMGVLHPGMIDRAEDEGEEPHSHADSQYSSLSSSVRTDVISLTGSGGRGNDRIGGERVGLQLRQPIINDAVGGCG
jgi:hypothetical protein